MASTEHDSRIQTVCLAILSIFAVAFALYFMRSVVVPFILAVFFALILLPLLNTLGQRLRAPRPLALTLTLLTALLILVIVGGVISVSVGRLAANAGIYEQKITELLQQAANSESVQSLGVAIDREIDLLSLVPEGMAEGFVVRLTNGVINIISQSVLVLLFVTFLLLGSQTSQVPKGGVFEEVENRVKKYIVTKTILSAITGVLVFLILSFIGVDYALSFGAFAFILNFIPNIGSIVATFLPVPVVLLTPEISNVSIAMAILIPGIVQFTIGSIMEPKIMGESFNIHPVVVLMSLIFWGVILGFNGMFLAVPLTIIAKIVFERIELTRPVAQVMEGQLDSLNVK